MTNRNFLIGILVTVLIFGMTASGCNHGTNETGDTWVNITNFEQLNGTWKSINSLTKSMKNFINNDVKWNSEDLSALYGDDMKVTISTEIIVTFDASAKTQTGFIRTTLTYSGGKIVTAWPTIKAGFSDPEVLKNDYDYSISEISNIDETLTETDIENILANFLINQNGRKIKSTNIGEEIILIKK